MTRSPDNIDDVTNAERAATKAPLKRFDFRALLARLTPDAEDPVSACKLCNDTTWLVTEGVARRCVCRATKHAPDVPREFHNATMENYELLPGNATAKTHAKLFFRDDATQDLYLCGGIGTGKTRLACTILNECHTRGMTTYFTRAVQLLKDLQPNDNEGIAFTVEQRVKAARVMVIDDLGAERDVATDYTRRTLLMLYEQRRDAGLRTIWTSNKSLQQLSDMLDDERLVSRIYGRSKVVELTTPDQRHARR